MQDGPSIEQGKNSSGDMKHVRALSARVKAALTPDRGPNQSSITPEDDMAAVATAGEPALKLGVQLLQRCKPGSFLSPQSIQLALALALNGAGERVVGRRAFATPPTARVQQPSLLPFLSCAVNCSRGPAKAAERVPVGSSVCHGGSPLLSGMHQQLVRPAGRAAQPSLPQARTRTESLHEGNSSPAGHAWTD